MRSAVILGSESPFHVFNMIYNYACLRSSYGIKLRNVLTLALFNTFFIAFTQNYSNFSMINKYTQCRKSDHSYCLKTPVIVQLIWKDAKLIMKQFYDTIYKLFYINPFLKKPHHRHILSIVV